MKLFVDYDDTIMASSERAIKWFIDKGKTPSQFHNTSSIDFGYCQLVYSPNILCWSYANWFEDVSQEEVREMLDSKEYIDSTQFVENAFAVLKRLSKFLDIYIVTVGTSENLALKLDFIKRTFPFVKGVICSTDFNKGLINMEDSIFIDDRSDFLGQSNAKNKILFKYKEIERETNQDWVGPVVFNWSEAEALIRNYGHYQPHYTGRYHGKYPAV